MASRSHTSKKKNNTNWQTVPYVHDGKPEQVTVEVPAEIPAHADSNRQEVVHFVQTLEANQQIQHHPGRLANGATHQIETDEAGTKRIVRKRFSAI